MTIAAKNVARMFRMPMISFYPVMH
jgi:hypothetical protein